MTSGIKRLSGSASRGFTLIELMIVVAVIAILAAIAIAAYQQYLKEAQTAKVTRHYDDAIRVVRAEFAKRIAQMSNGRNDLVAIDVRFVISNLANPDGRPAPLGGPAFIPGDADPATGAIGIEVGGGGRPGTEFVTIRRPAFLEDMAAENITLYANSVR